MIKQEKLEDLIKEKIFLGNPDARGFYSHKCMVCNDYKVRAGFKFEDNSVGFNCWNCSTTARYEEFSGRISKKMRQILQSYGIEESEVSRVVNSTFFFKKEEEPKTLSLKTLTKVNTNTAPVKLPPDSFKLLASTEHMDVQEKIVNYLSGREIDLEKHTFFYSLSDRYKNRVIIPYYRNGQLIYWQARSMDKMEKKRYDNCIASRDAVMFNMDALNRYSPLPLFVSEGPFDAMMFDGIATLGSKLTDAKLELLNQSKRRLVFVMDKDKNGKEFAEKIIDAGWEITFPPEGTEDVNNSVQRFGKSWTAQQLMKNIPASKDDAKFKINYWFVNSK